MRLHTTCATTSKHPLLLKDQNSLILVIFFVQKVIPPIIYHARLPEVHFLSKYSVMHDVRQVPLNGSHVLLIQSGLHAD